MPPISFVRPRRPLISTASQTRWHLLGAAGPCSLNGNLVTTGEDYDAWRYTLEKTVRKELERSWRVFTREPAASFAIITDADEALRIFLRPPRSSRARGCRASG